MNLENLNLVELNAQEKREIEGGMWGLVFTAVGMAGAACAWAWEKGESLGKAMA
jgi:hypothetical protein